LAGLLRPLTFQVRILYTGWELDIKESREQPNEY
jgi:hypothetical protein